MTKTVRIVNVQVKGTRKRPEMRNDCCKTHVKTFKDGAEYYAQRQNKAPGRKYVVSWMTKTVKKRK